jgi:polyhydroxyalkanoate synthesis repressor PhaR
MGVHVKESAVQSKKSGVKPVQRVIKKYPNRRLYDTETSTYITLAEVKQLVMESAQFVVRDAKTNDDLTRSILLQIILEEEAGGAPMFSEQVLANIIRFYGRPCRASWGLPREERPGLHGPAGQDGRAAEGLTPEMWAQFMSMQSPMLQGLMGNYVEQSKNVFLADAGADAEKDRADAGGLWHQATPEAFDPCAGATDRKRVVQSGLR